MSKFPFIEVSGTSDDIGQQHGQMLADKIAACYELYEQTWRKMAKDAVDFKAWGDYFAKQVRDFSADYANEIDAIADGANMPAWKIYALNGRSEIYNAVVNNNKLTECTALYFARNSILGENWDWLPELEDLSVIMQITQKNGHQILMLAEPGIIGKIGFNSQGLGVCLNMLNHPGEVGGIPIHILLRVVLDSQTIEEAVNTVKAAPRQTSSNFIIGDANGHYKDLEFANTALPIIDTPCSAFVHTNHYLSKNLGRPEDFQNSLHRYQRASEMVAQGSLETVDDMKKILSDRSHSEYPICRDYKMSDNFIVGTVSSVVMDLPNRVLHYTPGNPLKVGYTQHAL